MKLTITKTETVEFDMEAERERINRASFTPEQRERLLKVCDLFEEEKFMECIREVQTWGRCPKEECPETEFLGIEIGDALQAVCRGYRVQITEKKPKPKCGNDGSSWQRMDCEYDEAGICIHCKVEVPF